MYSEGSDGAGRSRNPIHLFAVHACILIWRRFGLQGIVDFYQAFMGYRANPEEHSEQRRKEACMQQQSERNASRAQAQHQVTNGTNEVTRVLEPRWELTFLRGSLLQKLKHPCTFERIGSWETPTFLRAIRKTAPTPDEAGAEISTRLRAKTAL